MDTIFPKGNIVDMCGDTCVQVFVGMHSGSIFAKLLHSKSEGLHALQDFIFYVGCPQRLHLDRSKMKLSAAITEIYDNAYIPQSTTESSPYIAESL